MLCSLKLANLERQATEEVVSIKSWKLSSRTGSPTIRFLKELQEYTSVKLLQCLSLHSRDLQRQLAFFVIYFQDST